MFSTSFSDHTQKKNSTLPFFFFFCQSPHTDNKVNNRTREGREVRMDTSALAMEECLCNQANHVGKQLLFIPFRPSFFFLFEGMGSA